MSSIELKLEPCMIVITTLRFCFWLNYMMNSTGIESNCISRILRINDGMFSIGIFQDQGSLVSKEWISSTSKLKGSSFPNLTSLTIERYSFNSVNCLKLESMIIDD